MADVVTKQDAAATDKRILQRIDEAQEELARMTSGGFLDIQNRLDVREPITRTKRSSNSVLMRENSVPFDRLECFAYHLEHDPRQEALGS